MQTCIIMQDVKRLAKKKGRSNPMVVCRVCPGQKLVRNIQKHMDKFHTVKPKKQKVKRRRDFVTFEKNYKQLSL